MSEYQEKCAFVVGSSDGIGLALVKKLCASGYRVVGFSRSPSKLNHNLYRHEMIDVCHPDFENILRQELDEVGSLDLFVYCAGIGDLLSLDSLDWEVKTMEVNLWSAIRSTKVVIEHMLKQQKGHFIGLSSIADSVVSREAPSYAASKAGVSRFWEGLALNLRHRGVHLSNVRFGFVDTKMAKGSFRPFMMSPEKASESILKIVKKPKIRYTKPLLMDFLARLLNLKTKLELLFR